MHHKFRRTPPRASGGLKWEVAVEVFPVCLKNISPARVQREEDTAVIVKFKKHLTCLSATDEEKC